MAPHGGMARTPVVDPEGLGWWDRTLTRAESERRVEGLAATIDWLQREHPDTPEEFLAAERGVLLGLRRRLDGERPVIPGVGEGRKPDHHLDAAGIERLLGLVRAGTPQGDVAQRLGVAQSTVSRHVSIARREGRI